MLPAGVAFVSASPGLAYSAGNVTGSIGTLANGASSNLSIIVTPSAGGLLTNVVTAASPITDPNLANNTSSLVLHVPVSPTISSVKVTSTNVSLSFTSVAGLNYTLEYKNTLLDASWTPILPAVPGTGGILTLLDNSPAIPSRFYRISSN